MPHKSVKAAEKAAIEGEVDEWDTQQCEALREELLPSSPNRASAQVASANGGEIAIPSIPGRKIVDKERIGQVQESSEPGVGVDAAVISDAIWSRRVEEDGNGHPNDLEHPTILVNELRPRPADPQTSPRTSVQYRRDNRGKLRAFAATGEEYRPADFSNKYQELAQVPTMDDLTQKSSMSATQENPPYLYDQFHIQDMIRNDCPSTATNDDDEDPPAAVHDPRHASASTAYTYQENDTGHINLRFDAETIEEEDDGHMEESQDASYAMPAVQSYGSFEPKTPAPPVNPFLQKGSVMKGFELFGATQPSSVGRHMASPTSSRPSPDVYNNFSSPPKRQTLMMSSPLGGGLAPEPDSPPLHSSVRNLLARSQSGNSRAAQSFDTGPKNLWARPEPRPYVSMKESQEKRRQTTELDLDSNSSGDDSDIEATPRRNRKTERELLIRKELAAVELHKRASSNPRSSAPASSTAAVHVEVPSTGRRRSLQDDYISQCTGHDARDTQQDELLDAQQDDVIVDSQAAVTEDPEHDGPDTGVSMSETREEEMDQGLTADVTQNTNSSDPQPDMAPEPSLPLPLQETSPNRSNVPPASSKIQSDAVTDTVPETSPAPEDRLRPMAEIASISFGAGEELPDNFPGFTQDLEFDDAMQIRSSPKPPARMQSFGRAAKVPSINSLDAANSSANSAASSLTSSALSSPPNSAVLEELEAEVSLPVVEKPVRDLDVPAEEPKDKEDVVAANSVLEETVEEDAVTTPPVYAPTPVDKPPADLQEDGDTTNTTNGASLPKQKPAKRPLKTYSRRKGPAARSLDQSVNTAATTPRQSSRVSKMSPAPNPSPTPRSTPIVPEYSSIRKTTVPKQQTPQAALGHNLPSASTAVNKRTSKRKSGATVVHDDLLPTRSSKRQSTAKDSSPDPLALPSPIAVGVGRSPKGVAGLFKDMSFAVSFVSHEREKDEVTKAIFDQGGRILPDGFDSLFESAKSDEEMSLSPSAKSVGFVALIADEHSRKAKYMQALALGLPCISGHWITACVAKDSVVDWSPYLLCAGQSSILGNAHKSRVLQPYPAQEAKFEDTFANRDKLLQGKSILLVTGKGKLQEKRKAYSFLAHALGPARISQVADYQEARKKLSQEEDQEWDLLYVDTHQKAAEEAVFGTPTTLSSSAARKRKRIPMATAVDDSPAPKKIRIISDETMIQSLILGQLLDD